jgi:GNAT superfamily N-acetyltransferase
MFQTFIKDPYDWEAVKQFEVRYFQEKMRASQFAAWVAETADGAIIATAAVSFYETAPKPWNLESKYAFVSSMYTEPEYRRQGIGARLLKEALDYSRSQGITHATLHASQSGKSLYESFGFEDTNGMRLAL